MEKSNDAAGSSGLIICLKCKKYYDQNLNCDNFYQYCAECHRSIDNSIGANELNVMPIDRKHKCTICGKIFRFPSWLAAHMRSHTGEKPYECEFCDKSFSQLNGLKEHYRIHSGEKPFKCDFCTKSFRQLSNLHTHRRTHTRDESMKCRYCAESLGTHYHRNWHEVVHSGVKPYKCCVCNRIFTSLRALKCHRRSHAEVSQCNEIFQDKTVEQQSKCEYCGEIFTKDADLIHHEMSHWTD